MSFHIPKLFWDHLILTRIQSCLAGLMESHVVHIREWLNMVVPAASLIAQLPDWLLEVIAQGILELGTPEHLIRQTWFPRPRSHISALPQTEDLPSSWDDLAQRILNSFGKCKASRQFEWFLSLFRTPGTQIFKLQF